MKDLITPTIKWASAHSTELLTGVAIGGVLTSVGLTAQAAVNIHGHCEAKRMETGSEPKPAETIKETWKDWAPPAISTGLTIASIVMLHKVHRDKEAALAALAAMWQGRFIDLNKRVRELPNGKNVIDSFRKQEMSEHLPDKAPVLQKDEILVYEPMSKQFFISSNQEITSAELVANKIMQRESALTLNEFLRLFRNAHSCVFGDGIGWFKTSDQWQYAWDLYGQCWVDILPYQATVKGRPCVYLDYGVQMTSEDPSHPPAVYAKHYDK